MSTRREFIAGSVAVVASGSVATLGAPVTINVPFGCKASVREAINAYGRVFHVDVAITDGSCGASTLQQARFNLRG